MASSNDGMGRLLNVKGGNPFPGHPRVLSPNSMLGDIVMPAYDGTMITVLLRPPASPKTAGSVLLW